MPSKHILTGRIIKEVDDREVGWTGLNGFTISTKEIMVLKIKVFEYVTP